MFWHFFLLNGTASSLAIMRCLLPSSAQGDSILVCLRRPADLFQLMCGSPPCQGPPPLQSLPLWNRHQLLPFGTKDRMQTDQGWFLPMILGKEVSPFFVQKASQYQAILIKSRPLILGLPFYWQFWQLQQQTSLRFFIHMRRWSWCGRGHWTWVIVEHKKFNVWKYKF